MKCKSSISDLDSEAVIKLLDLKPHPEGGYFAESFRDEEPKNKRGYSTAIYYLLKRGEVSNWHRIDSVEIWHWYAGSPLQLSILSKDEAIADQILGPNLPVGQRPQIVVPRLSWQSAKSMGNWTLVGCTVSPAFEFDGFEMAPSDWVPGDSSCNG